MTRNTVPKAFRRGDGSIEIRGRRYNSLKAFLELNPSYHPVQKKVDAVDAAIDEAVGRAIAPFQEIYDRTLEIQTFLVAQNDEERAQVSRRSLKVQLALIVLILVWVRVVAPLVDGAVNVASAPDSPIANGIAPDTTKKVEGSSEIAGYPTTDGHLPCKNPDVSTADCRTWEGYPRAHNGVDVSTPTGTVLYVPGIPGDTVTVKCSGSASSSEGYGLLAEIVPSRGDVFFLAGHLSNCAGGEMQPGEVFGATGNSGYSTGPHLHWEERSKDTDEPVKPTFSWLFQALNGNPPSPPLRTKPDAEEGGNDEV